MVTLKTQIGMSKRVQIGLLVGMTVASSLFYFFGYRPANQRLADLAHQKAMAQRNLELSQGEARRVPQVAADLARLRAQLADFKRLPDKPDLGDFLGQITRISDITHVRKLDVTFPAAPHATEDYTELPVQLKFEGDFISVFAFLQAAEDMPRLTRVANISIEESDFGSGIVKVDMSLNLYFSEG